MPASVFDFYVVSGRRCITLGGHILPALLALRSASWGWASPVAPGTPRLIGQSKGYACVCMAASGHASDSWARRWDMYIYKPTVTLLIHSSLSIHPVRRQQTRNTNILNFDVLRYKNNPHTHIHTHTHSHQHQPSICVSPLSSRLSPRWLAYVYTVRPSGSENS